MNEGRTVFAQLLDFLPQYEFDKWVARSHGNFRVRKLPTYEQFLVLAFAQLTWRESLRDIETCLAALGPKLYHAGIRQPTARNAGSFYIMDRGYLDFARWHRIHQCGAFFVTRAKHNFRCARRYSRRVDKTTGLRFDQTVVMTGLNAQHDYPVPLRRIGYRDSETGKGLVFLTNNFTVPALTIAQLYRGRWQIELFFKWVKQHLRIKAFYGTSANAVRTQIWTTIAVYLLVAILKKRLRLEASLYTILQILSLTLFEKMPISQALSQFPLSSPSPGAANHQCLLPF